MRLDAAGVEHPRRRCSPSTPARGGGVVLTSHLPLPIAEPAADRRSAGRGCAAPPGHAANERHVRRRSSPATCRLAARRRVDALLPIAFFTVAVSLFPLGVGPEPQMLRQIAPGVVWVARSARGDAVGHPALRRRPTPTARSSRCCSPAAGTRRSIACSPRPRRTGSLTGLPLVVVAPLFGAAVRHARRRRSRRWSLSLVLGTPVLSLLGGLGAALTLGLRSGAVLLILIIVPLCIPALIFGAGAVGGGRCRPVGARATIRCSARS